MLVSAFAGYERIMALYRHAIAQRYRFFSYGDAMLLARATPILNLPARTTMLKFELQNRPASADGHLAAAYAPRSADLNHGVVQTPIFMPVGTYGTAKGHAAKPARHGRTDHPGQHLPPVDAPRLDVMTSFGGLHGFEQWNKPILTDSGGFPGVEPGGHAQDHRRGRALCLAGERRQVVHVARGEHANPDGAEFRHRDAAGRMHPTKSGRQTAGHITTEHEARHSMEMSLRWASARRPNLSGCETPMPCSASFRWHV